MGQWLKSLGATSIGTVGSADKIAVAKTSGYAHVIDYRADDFPARVKDITGGKGCDVVYDSVGKTTFEKSLNCLRPRGMMVLFGGSSGAVPPFDLIQLSTRGSLFVTRPTLKDYIATRADLEHRAGDVFRWVAEAKLKVRAEHLYRLEDAAQAQIDIASRNTTGKLLLIP